MNLIDKIKLAREGAAVERCHTSPHRLRYSVGHHSLDLVAMITLAWMEDHGEQLPSAELLIAAAFHDIPERVIGDIPSPVKNLLEGRLDEVEERVLSSLGVRMGLTPEESLYLHQGDNLECWLWAVEQVRSGDRNFESWVNYYSAKWRPIENGVRVLCPAYDYIFRNVDRAGLPWLTSSELLETAGLS